MNTLHKNIFFNTVLSDESVDSYVSRLSYSVAPILSLFVHGWVPVSLIENDIAGSSEIEANASGPCAANEAQYPRIVVESFDDSLPHFCLGVAIKPDIVEFEHIEYLLKDV